jgi:hypothetical protein
MAQAAGTEDRTGVRFQESPDLPVPAKSDAHGATARAVVAVVVGAHVGLARGVRFRADIAAPVAHQNP